MWCQISATYSSCPAVLSWILPCLLAIAAPSPGSCSFRGPRHSWGTRVLQVHSFTDCSGVPSGPKLNEPCLLRYMKDAPSLALILHLSMWIPFQCCLKPLKSYRILSKIVLFSQKPPFSPLDANMSSPGLGEKFVSQTQCYVPRIGTPLFQMISKDNYGCNSPILVLGWVLSQRLLAGLPYQFL